MAELRLEDAVDIGYALVAHVARVEGLRTLAIKGPVLHLQGLRAPKQSVDVDVLVAPEDLESLQCEFARLGWAEVEQPSTARVLPKHSLTLRSPLWPCEIDLHSYFPGILAEASTAFDLLWARREYVEIANTPISATGKASSAVIAALHLLRDSASAEGSLDALAETLRSDPSLCAEIASVARETMSQVPLRPLFDQLPISVDNDDAPAEALFLWRMRTSGASVRSIPTLAALTVTPARSLPSVLWRRLWLTDDELRASDASMRPGTRGLFEARVGRLAAAVCALPAAIRIWVPSSIELLRRRSRRESVTVHRDSAKVETAPEEAALAESANAPMILRPGVGTRLPSTGPMVSVVIAAKDAESSIALAIRSALDQWYDHLEVVVVDDGSSDGTWQEIARIDDPRLRGIRLPKNVGRGAARNAGIAASRGEFIAILDADDIATPWRLAATITPMLADANVGVVGGQALCKDDRLGYWRLATYPLGWSKIRDAFHAGGMPVCHGGSMIRRRAFDEVGGYDEGLTRAQDFDLLRRLANSTSIVGVPVDSITYSHPVILPFSYWRESRYFSALVLGKGGRIDQPLGARLLYAGSMAKRLARYMSSRLAAKRRELS